MTGNVFTYSAANSLLGALRRKGFSRGIVQNLASTADLESCLEQLPLQVPQFDVSRRIGEQPIISRQPVAAAEDNLHRHYKNSCRKLLRFLPAQASYLLRVFLSFYDFAVLKRFFRKAVFPDFSTETMAAPSPGSFLNQDEHDVNKKSVSIDDLPAMVRGTPLAKPVEKALLQYQRKPFMYYFEIILDAGYLMLLDDAVDKLDSDEAAAARFHIIDLYSGFKEFTWALRMYFYHQMDPHETGYFLPFTSRCFTRKHFDAVMSGGTEAEAVAALPPGRLARFLFHEDRGAVPQRPETLEELDLLGNRRLYQLITRKQVTTPFTLTSFISFFMTQKYILDDIVTVIQSKRFSLSPDYLSKTLITEGAVSR